MAPPRSSRSRLRRILDTNPSTLLDDLLTPYIPPRALILPPLPACIRRFLAPRATPPPPLLSFLLSITLIAASIASLSLLHYSPLLFPLDTLSGPPLLGSFGASTILLFLAPHSPLTQPRNLLLAQPIAAAVGVGFGKIFDEELLWVGAVCALVCSAVLMVLLGCAHPPAGAAAVLAVSSEEVRRMGWRVVGYVAAGDLVLLLVAVGGLNGWGPGYPLWWWTGGSVGRDVMGDDGKGNEEMGSVDTDGDADRVVVDEVGVSVPVGCVLSREEREVLERIRVRVFGEGK